MTISQGFTWPLAKVLLGHWPSFFLAIDNNDANDDDGDGGEGGDGNGDDHDDDGGDVMVMAMMMTVVTQ